MKSIRKGWNIYFKRTFMLLLNLSIIVLLISGCSAPQETDDGKTAPADRIDVDKSFPNGAPPLNQTAELVCIVNNHAYITLRDMSVDITLPDGFELVSGELSWLGDIPEGDEVEVIRAVIKSVKVGHWTIDCTSYLDPEKHGGLGRHDAFDVYVLVSEDSAEWAYWALWKKGDPSDPSIVKVAEPGLPNQNGEDIPSIEPPALGQPKLSGTLNQLIRAEEQGEADEFAQQRGIELVDGSVKVIIECEPGQAEAVAEAASALGIVEIPILDLVQLVVPINNLTALEDIPGVSFVRLP